METAMKYTVCTIALLLLLTASAQATMGTLKGVVVDHVDIHLEERTQTLYTAPAVNATVDVMIIDSVFALTNAQVAIGERGRSVTVDLNRAITLRNQSLKGHLPCVGSPFLNNQWC